MRHVFEASSFLFHSILGPTAPAVPAIVGGVDTNAGDGAGSGSARPSAEVDAAGRPYLPSEKWRKMGGTGDERPGLVDRVITGLYGNLPPEDRLRVAWLAGTLFFIIGG